MNKQTATTTTTKNHHEVTTTKHTFHILDFPASYFFLLCNNHVLIVCLVYVLSLQHPVSSAFLSLQKLVAVKLIV